MLTFGAYADVLVIFFIFGITARSFSLISRYAADPNSRTEAG